MWHLLWKYIYSLYVYIYNDARKTAPGLGRSLEDRGVYPSSSRTIFSTGFPISRAFYLITNANFISFERSIIAEVSEDEPALHFERNIRVFVTSKVIRERLTSQSKTMRLVISSGPKIIQGINWEIIINIRFRGNCIEILGPMMSFFQEKSATDPISIHLSLLQARLCSFYYSSRSIREHCYESRNARVWVVKEPAWILDAIPTYPLDYCMYSPTMWFIIHDVPLWCHCWVSHAQRSHI